MANEIAKRFANSDRAMVVAPAGCGKTHLIAESVGHCEGRQLILTHTHAGVRAILNRLHALRLEASRFRVVTIDGFALQYATAFPMLSGWSDPHPSGDESWKQLRSAACYALNRKAVQRVVSSSYRGIFVDEYQDCTIGQHKLVQSLGDILPCRIVGDPLQAVFYDLNSTDHCEWSEVDLHFELLDELSTPHRWLGRNEDLGRWLLGVRQLLIEGEPVDISSAPISWENGSDEQARLRACYNITRNRNESALVLRQFRPQCNKMARSLKGIYRSMETVECEDLLEWANKIETGTGGERVCRILEFADICIARIPQAVKQFAARFASNKTPRPRRDDYLRLVNALQKVRDNNDIHRVLSAMKAIDDLDESLVYARRELWLEMQRTLTHQINREVGASMAETAWKVRNQSRIIGRRVDHRCISTTLLVKGLEFDHAAILRADDHPTAEHFYVALTRGARSLTILSESNFLQRPKPRYVISNDDPSTSRELSLQKHSEP